MISNGRLQPCFLRCYFLPPENVNSGTAKTLAGCLERGWEATNPISQNKKSARYLARNHHMRPMLMGDLLLQGTAMSMNLVGESTLQKATMGMLA